MPSAFRSRLGAILVTCFWCSFSLVFFGLSCFLFVSATCFSPCLLGNFFFRMCCVSIFPSRAWPASVTTTHVCENKSFFDIDFCGILAPTWMPQPETKPSKINVFFELGRGRRSGGPKRGPRAPKLAKKVPQDAPRAPKRGQKATSESQHESKKRPKAFTRPPQGPPQARRQMRVIKPTIPSFKGETSKAEGLRGAQELSWARFWVDLEGFGEGSGRILELKIDVFLAFSAHVA